MYFMMLYIHKEYSLLFLEEKWNVEQFAACDQYIIFYIIWLLLCQIPVKMYYPKGKFTWSGFVKKQTN